MATPAWVNIVQDHVCSMKELCWEYDNHVKHALDVSTKD